MGRIYETLDGEIGDFIRRQHLFFVATAPTDPEAHLNISPRGLDCLRILGPTTVAWLDLTGSGIETVAHVRDNGRITLLFCAFEGTPRIVRLYGHGEVIPATSPLYAELRPRFPPLPGARAIIRVHVTRIADSCGLGVPLMTFVSDRRQLVASAVAKGPQGLRDYRLRRNAASIDGLPGLTPDDIEDIPSIPISDQALPQ